MLTAHTRLSQMGSRPLIHAGDTTQNASGDLVFRRCYLARAKGDMRIRQAGEGLRICQAARGSSCLGPFAVGRFYEGGRRHHESEVCKVHCDQRTQLEAEVDSACFCGVMEHLQEAFNALQAYAAFMSGLLRSFSSVISQFG